MTAEQLPAELAGWPAWTPGEAQLGELELIISGAFTPLGGYLTTADLTAVAARSELADGTPWPMPVTLTVPASAIPDDAAHLVLQDPEGSPLAGRPPGGERQHREVGELGPDVRGNAPQRAERPVFRRAQRGDRSCEAERGAGGVSGNPLGDVEHG